MPQSSLTPDQKARLVRLRMMIFDVDGVLTDGGIIYQDGGVEQKAFDVKDGHGIKLLLRAGLDVAIITGRSSEVVTLRAADLGIKHVYQRSRNKVEALADIMQRTGLEEPQLGFMADDLIDIPVMRRVGFAVAVADASPHIFPYAHYQTRARGGRGACREVCELILQVQGRWTAVTERYFGGEAG
jgi:3-deoxy-D-manno-octulosonate 8-phosphate phosphatase (KDO 8-P phosphatase)